MAKLIYDLTYTELKAYLSNLNEPSYRIDQIWHGLYKNLWDIPGEFTNLPNKLRDSLNKDFRFSSLEQIAVIYSDDKKTRKVLFLLPDNQKIETVLMRYDRRRTLCISTQVGCAMGCVFCATGQMGYRRNLTPGEIVAQVMFFSRLLAEENQAITNIVFMGMGEPFHNYKHSMAAIDQLNDPNGFNFGARRITLSTVGIIPAIRLFTNEKRQVNLAISLHAADDALRSSLLPIAQKYCLDELFSVCAEYCRVTKRRITFEWALISGVNDTPEQAKLLANKIKGMLSHVNLIPLNPTHNYNQNPSTIDRANQFLGILQSNGIHCSLRVRRGLDIDAGCGQLATNNK